MSEAVLKVLMPPKAKKVDPKLNAWVFISKKDEDNEEIGEFFRATAASADLIVDQSKSKKEVAKTKVTAKLENGTEVTVPKGEWLVGACSEDTYEPDMGNLQTLNNATVLHNLRTRLENQIIYTYSGLFLVVVNPYTYAIADKIYSDAVVDAYRGQLRHNRPPHLFAMADEAYRTMLNDKVNQSILCTGESGAGKTENTKKVIQYLTKVAAVGKTRNKPSSAPQGASGTDDAAKLKLVNMFTTYNKGANAFAKALGRTWRNKIKRKSGVAAIARTEKRNDLGDLEEQVINANEVLEPFGNAKTTRNNNSSRFGKFIKVLFDSGGYLGGCSIETYLLEKARVIAQGVGEANFHVFYFVLYDSKLRTEFELTELKSKGDYEYITNGPDDTIKPSLDALSKYFGQFEVDASEIHSIYQIIAGILHLGNVNKYIKSRDELAKATLDSSGSKLVELVCKLFGIKDKKKFSQALVSKSVMRSRSEFNKKEARENIGAVAKAVFERMFVWIVIQLNSVLERSAASSKDFVGILDIAGFEIFEVNSFEQLCINFTNERLQKLFNDRMFALEQKEYAKEGIAWKDQDYGEEFNLDLTIELIDGKVLSALNDKCKARNASDKEFSQMVVKNCADHPKFEKPKPSGGRKRQQVTQTDFVIKHYAGEVEYNVEGWVAKNQDSVNAEIKELLEQSENAFMKELWENTTIKETLDGSSRGKQYVAQVYSKQLKKLIKTLMETKTHFVRCIKPNSKKAAFSMEAPMVLDQLKCNGVLEGIKIASQGYPRRVEYESFNRQYAILAAEAAQGDAQSNTKGVLTALMTKPGFEFLKGDAKQADKFQFGKTKVFFRKNVLLLLDEKRDEVISEVIIRLQQHVRGYIARKIELPQAKKDHARLMAKLHGEPEPEFEDEPEPEPEPVVEDRSAPVPSSVSIPDPADVPAVRRKMTPAGKKLAEAAAAGDVDAMRALLEQEADAYQCADSSGRTALHWAAGMGQCDAMELLVSKGMHISTPTKTGRTAVHIAAGLGEVDTLKWLVAHHASVLEADVTGATALHKAAQWDQVEVLDFLAQQGVDLQGTTKMGQTAVHTAARDGQLNSLQWLLEHGVPLSTPDAVGKTPLHIAAEYDKVEAMSFLVSNHCDKDAVDANGDTALHCAAIRGADEAVEWLLAAGLEVNAVDHAKRTPLHLAAWQGRSDVIKTLVGSGADKSLLDEAGLPASSYAKSPEASAALA